MINPTFDSCAFARLTQQHLATLPHGTLLHVTDIPSHWNIEIGGAYSHPEGLVIRIGNRFLLNGESLCEHPFLRIHPHKEGVVIACEDGNWLNGTTKLPTDKDLPIFSFPAQGVKYSGEELLFTDVAILKSNVDQFEGHHFGYLIRKANLLYILVIVIPKTEPQPLNS